MSRVFAESGAPQPRGAHVLDFISRAAAPVVAKKSDGNRFRPLQVSDFATNAQHTEPFQEEKSADDEDFEKVVCEVCEVENMSGTA